MNQDIIEYKIYLKADITDVFNRLTTKYGIESFWVEEADIQENKILFKFPNGMNYSSTIIRKQYPSILEIDYFDSRVEICLISDEHSGTHLILKNEGVDSAEFAEVSAGWVSVLMNLKAVIDFGCDLRNHDEHKTWDQGYINN